MSEHDRLAKDATREENWKRFGPYLSERQWGTVREDYSEAGDSWDYFPHDQARSRVYRWGEDGLLGFTDRQCRLCFALSLWNGRDPFLKERLFGLTGPQGNHGEDVKEIYHYLDSTPTHSYTKALYRYPQAEFPYQRLVDENRRRSRDELEFELVDTGIYDDGRYFDVEMETAKGSPNDVCVRVTVHNRGPDDATLDLVANLWFRNTWGWARRGDGHDLRRPRLWKQDERVVATEHDTLGEFLFEVDEGGELLFTENETNNEKLFRSDNVTAFVKDAFHAVIVDGYRDAVNPDGTGTKAGAWYHLDVPAGGSRTLRFRLHEREADAPTAIDEVFRLRIDEADAFYDGVVPRALGEDERRVMRQAYAGLLFTKQFYHYAVDEWLEGDPNQPTPPRRRLTGRNHEWDHVFCRDVLSMPDKWEYPWFALWDLAFHTIPFADVDIEFAKQQLVLFLREWYMHPNGQMPAYEFAFDDVNPPVHAWAAWRIYKMTGRKGRRDRVFLARVFQKLLLNFTWWVNRKDRRGRNLFSGGFLGLDNIGIFDRSKPLPTGGFLEQADGTAWMGFYCGTMLAMALELARTDPAAEDMASKFFEHFVAIIDAINHLDGDGLWDEQDGFYYDHLRANGASTPLRVRSLVGLIPLIAVETLEDEDLQRMPGFFKRFQWFLENREDLARNVVHDGREGHRHWLLAVPTKERLRRILTVLFDEREFLSPYGIRSLSRVHAERPFVLRVGGEEHRVEYVPGESDSGLFGGNSNWRGPIWFPLNYLILEALERYHHFYGDELRVEYPTGSGRELPLDEIARDIEQRLARIFLLDESGERPCHGGDPRFRDPHWRDTLLFHEYFHGDDGRGLGASHQTGWTALVVRWLRDVADSE